MEHTLDMIKNIHEKIIEYGSAGNRGGERYLQAPSPSHLQVNSIQAIFRALWASEMTTTLNQTKDKSF